MKFIQNISIKQKLIAVIMIAFIISTVFSGLYTIFSLKKSKKETSVKTAQLLADNYSQRIKLYLDKEVQLSELLSSLFISEEKFNREYIVKMFNGYMSGNEYIKEMYFFGEQYFPDRNKGFDSTSYNVYSETNNNNIYLVKDEDEIIFKKGERDEMLYNKDIYEELKLNRKLIVSEPYLIKHGNKNRLSLAVISPIISSDEFYGIVGFTLLLDKADNLINEPLYINENIELMLLTGKSNIVSVSKKEWLAGKNIKNYRGKEYDLYSTLIDEYNVNYKENITTASSSFTLEDTEKEWTVYVFTPQNALVEDFIKNIFISIFITMFVLFIFTIILIYIVNRIFIPFKEIIKNANKISLGEIPKLNKSSKSDELTEINNSLVDISDKLNSTARISSEIASGNYTDKLNVESQNDVLSLSINKIIKSLKEIEKETELKQKDSEIQSWIRKGKQEVADAQRISSNELDQLALNLIKSLVNFSGAVLGGIYMNTSKGSPFIELVAAYAYGNQKNMKKKFSPGEGLIGTCAIEKKKIELKNVPADYITIASGLGSAPPEYLLILPILNNKNLIAFLEIAFVKQPEEFKTDFIEQLTENFGAWLESSLINAQTADLLKQSQETTKELYSKEGELNTKIKELEDVQKQYSDTMADMTSMLNAVNHTVMTIEYTTDGTLLNANEMYLNSMGYDIEDLRGINVFDLVKDQREDLQNIVSEVLKGKQINRNVKRYTKSGEERLMSASYTPYYNAEGKISRVIYFAFDITNLVGNIDDIT